jgi:hypothetical protein
MPMLAGEGAYMYPFDWTLEARLINLLNHLRSFYSSRPVQAYHFQTDQIWWSSLFSKSSIM